MADDIRNDGDNNVVVGGGVRGNRNVIGNGNIIHEADHRDPLNRIGIEAHRTFIKPIGHLKAKHLGVVGGISFGMVILNMLSIIGSVASIYSVMYGTLSQGAVTTIQSMAFLLFFIGSFPLFLWLYFRRAKSLRLGILGSIEVGHSGRLFLTNVRAKCPFCPGSMTMFSGGQHERSHVLVCDRGGSDHRIGFDMTTFADVEDEYEARREKKG